MCTVASWRQYGSALAAACVVLVWSTAVLAGGTRSNELAGRGGPVADSARGLVANPAAIGPVGGISTDFDIQVEWRNQDHTRDTTFVRDDGRTFGSVGSSTWRAFPTLAYASDLGLDWFTLGFAASVPWRYATSWPTDGPQRYHSIFLQYSGIGLTPAAAVSPLEWLHLGASMSYNLAEYESYRAVDTGKLVARQEGVDPSTVPSENPGNEGREHLTFSDGVVRWAAGVTVTPGDFRIGAAYHSGPDVELGGTYELLVPNNEFYQDRFGGDVERNATFRTARPSILRLGVAWAPSEQLEVYGHGEWTRWSTVDRIELDVENAASSGGFGGFGGGGGAGGGGGGSGSDRDFDRTRRLDWNDALGLRLGGRMDVTDDLALDGELGFETSAMPEEQLQPRVLDASKISAAAGVRWLAADTVSFRLGYQHVQHFARTVQQTEIDPPPTGDYRQWIGIVDTGFSYRFR